MPRWGLVDRVAQQGVVRDPTRRSPSELAVRATVLAAAGIFALAAAAHVVRYLLLLINRTTLLHPLVANGALLMGVLVSLAAMAALITAAAVATSWLIARRAAVFRLHDREDPRPAWTLWAGCMTPVVNLVWAPLFVIELAHAEHSQPRLKGPITMWWIAWVFATAVSGWAIWTSSATEPQAVADNTTTVIIAYLAGLATLLLLLRVVDTFVLKPVHRPAHRWVIVEERTAPADGDEDAETPSAQRPDGPDAPDEEPLEADSRDAVESGNREPAA